MFIQPIQGIYSNKKNEYTSFYLYIDVGTSCTIYLPKPMVSSGCLVDKTMVAAVSDNEAIASILKSNQEYSHHSAKDRCNAKMVLNF
jgi:hypothetical protein